MDIVLLFRKFQNYKFSQHLSATTIVQQTQSYLSIISKYEAGSPNLSETRCSDKSGSSYTKKSKTSFIDKSKTSYLNEG